MKKGFNAQSHEESERDEEEKNTRHDRMCVPCAATSPESPAPTTTTDLAAAGLGFFTADRSLSTGPASSPCLWRPEEADLDEDDDDRRVEEGRLGMLEGEEERRGEKNLKFFSLQYKKF